MIMEKQYQSSNIPQMAQAPAEDIMHRQAAKVCNHAMGIDASTSTSGTLPSSVIVTVHGEVTRPGIIFGVNDLHFLINR
jgi:hypothetical protein